MAFWPDFTGGMYQARSPLLAADQAINVYTETREVPGGKKQSTMYGTPGLLLETTVATVGCRGWFTQDGQTWVVVGATLYERTATGTYASRGTIANDGLPVSFACNGEAGNELAIVGGGELKVLDLLTNTLSSAITLPFAGPVMIVFIDGYGLINQADSIRVWFSALEDFTTWDALDYFARNGTSDDIVAIAVSKDRVWAIGSKTTTLYYDSGDVDTPFLPYPGTTNQVGIVSWTTLGVYSDTLCWIATSPRGAPRVVAAVDAAPQTISTPPIDAFLARCTSLENAETLVYEQEGHTFIAITCPSSPDDVQTYAFDLTEQLWHARAGWDEDRAVYTRWRARGVAAAGQDILVGDYASGAIYTLDLDTYEDNGVMLRRERVAPYPSAENQWGFLSEVELGTQAGAGLISGQGSAPQVELQISRDGTRTWISAGFAALGAQGTYLTRTIWRRLGRVRQDRIGIRIVQTDPVPCVWGPGLWLRFNNGSGEL